MLYYGEKINKPTANHFPRWSVVLYILIYKRVRLQYGKERIDKFISALMSFAVKTSKDLYHKSFNNLSDDEINNLIFNELMEIPTYKTLCRQYGRWSCESQNGRGRKTP